MTMAQMKWQAAIKKVLDAAEEPVHYTDIAQAIIDEGGMPPGVGPGSMRAAVSSMGTDFSILSRAAVAER